MPVQINEVIIRAVISGNDMHETSKQSTKTASDPEIRISKEELLDLIEEVILENKER